MKLSIVVFVVVVFVSCVPTFATTTSTTTTSSSSSSIISSETTEKLLDKLVMEKQKFETLRELLELKNQQVQLLQSELAKISTKDDFTPPVFNNNINNNKNKNRNNNSTSNNSDKHGIDQLRKQQLRHLREQVKEMFAFGWDAYMKHAYPKDELQPLTCDGRNVFGQIGYSLTLIDAMDTLAVLGNSTEFQRAISRCIREVTFDVDANVSVFETIIRALGGLLASHFLAVGLLPDWYDNDLVPLAEDLGKRLIVAFNTETGIPYGTVNLRHGIPSGETTITSAAGGGSNILEFAMLTRVTGDPQYELAARGALLALWSRRSSIGLVGNHINIISGQWTHHDSSVGTNVDSFYEYLAKAYFLLGDDSYFLMFTHCYMGITKHLRREHLFVDANMHTGAPTWQGFSSLAAFWPGIEALLGLLTSAGQTQRAIHNIWRKFGGIPETYNIDSGMPHAGNEGYPLRPEAIESLMYLHEATHDSTWLEMGIDIFTALQAINKVPCGYAGTINVMSRKHANRMDSYFLAETCKYLYLLFDPDNPLRKGSWVFTTEGHPFPIDVARMNDPLLPSLLAINSKESIGCLRLKYADRLILNSQLRHRSTETATQIFLQSVQQKIVASMPLSPPSTTAASSPSPPPPPTHQFQQQHQQFQQQHQQFQQQHQQHHQASFQKQYQRQQHHQQQQQQHFERIRQAELDRVQQQHEASRQREQQLEDQAQREAEDEHWQTQWRRHLLQQVGDCIFAITVDDLEPEEGIEIMRCDYHRITQARMWKWNLPQCSKEHVSVMVSASLLELLGETHADKQCRRSEAGSSEGLPMEISAPSLISFATKTYVFRHQWSQLRESVNLYHAVLPRWARYMRFTANWYIHWEQHIKMKGLQNAIWWSIQGGEETVQSQRISLLFDWTENVAQFGHFISAQPFSYIFDHPICRNAGRTIFGVPRLERMTNEKKTTLISAPFMYTSNDGPWRLHPWLPKSGIHCAASSCH